MGEENNNSNTYQFSKLFERVKNIFPVVNVSNQGNAYEFRENINKAIGTLPELDATGHIRKDEEGKYLDGKGMSGAVYAMGDIIDVGLSEIDTTLSDTKKATTDANAAAGAANQAVAEIGESIKKINEAKGVADAAALAAEKAKNDAEIAVNTGWGYSDAISGKTDRILVVSSEYSSSDARPFVVKNGVEQVVKQIKGGVWFKVLGEERITYGGAEIDDVSSTPST